MQNSGVILTDTGIRQRLAAILAADAAGYSRLMAGDERATLAALDSAREVFKSRIEANQGRVIDTAGDSVLAVFETASGAVTSALEIQNALAVSQAATPEERRMRFRIGIHLGDLIEKADGTVYGDGVNIAARLQALADAGGITVSGMVRDAVRNRIAASFADLGEQTVKNIAAPLRVFRIALGAAAAQMPSAAPALALPDKPSIAVLPFANLSGDPEQEYFADGITEDIITDISRISGLLVIARNSSFSFKKQNVDIKDVGRKLGVRHVLEGSVRKAGMKVRINVQLIDAETGGHVWAERYDRDLEDIFAVQDEVTRRVVDALKVNLTRSEEVRREDRGKVNPEAYDYLIRGRACLVQFTAEGALEGRAMLERALAIDPQLAPAYATLAILNCTEYVNGWNNPGADHLERALELARKAHNANEFEPASHLALAAALTWLGRQDDAERAARRAIELDPNLAQAHGVLGNILDFSGQHEKAIGLFEQAMRLDPQFDLWMQACGRAQFALERFGEAEASFKRRLIRMPHSDVTRAYLASLYGHTGRHEEARQMWRELMEINPKYSLELMRRVMPYRSSTALDRFFNGLRKAGLTP